MLAGRVSPEPARLALECESRAKRAPDRGTSPFGEGASDRTTRHFAPADRWSKRVPRNPRPTLSHGRWLLQGRHSDVQRGIQTQDPIARARVLQTEVVERLKTLPGVTSASAAVVLVISGGGWSGDVEVDGYKHRPDEDNQAEFNGVTPRFFKTMGTPLLLGRDFNERDTSSSKKVAIVNESFARYYFRDRSPLGLHVNQAEIVGVVTKAKYRNLREAFPKTVYFPLQQLDQPFPEYAYLAHVAAGDPMRLMPQVEQGLREIDPTLRVTNTQTFAEHIDRSILNERVLAALGGCFGLLGLVVACLGVFGVMAFQVARRTNELGVRMALGANRNDIIMVGAA